MTNESAYIFDFTTNTSKIASVPDPESRILDLGLCKIRVVVKWVETSWGNATHERQVSLDFSDSIDPFGFPYWQPITLETLPQLSQNRAFYHALLRLCDFTAGHLSLELDWRTEVEEIETDGVILGP
jgi:hypothetical protein